MMYDFHYPLGRGKLNEDTANCRAKQSGMMGKNAGPASLSQYFSLSLSLSLLCWKKGGPVAVVGLWSPSLPYLAAHRSSLTVHKSGAAYSWNYPESSTCNKLSDRFPPDYITLSVQTVLLTLTLPLYLLSVCHILNFLEIQTHPGTVRIKTKAGIIIRSSSLPSVRGGREGEAISGVGTKSVSRSSPLRSSSGRS